MPLVTVVLLSFNGLYSSRTVSLAVVSSSKANDSCNGATALNDFDNLHFEAFDICWCKCSLNPSILCDIVGDLPNDHSARWKVTGFCIV